VGKAISQADSVGNPLHIERAVTADLPDGQACPPYYDGAIWHVIRRADGRTTWRRLYLKSSPVVTARRAASAGQTRAP
jgi:hypothetical protein